MKMDEKKSLSGDKKDVAEAVNADEEDVIMKYAGNPGMYNQNQPSLRGVSAGGFNKPVFKSVAGTKRPEVKPTPAPKSKSSSSSSDMAKPLPYDGRPQVKVVPAPVKPMKPLSYSDAIGTSPKSGSKGGHAGGVYEMEAGGWTAPGLNQTFKNQKDAEDASLGRKQGALTGGTSEPIQELEGGGFLARELKQTFNTRKDAEEALKGSRQQQKPKQQDSKKQKSKGPFGGMFKSASAAKSGSPCGPSSSTSDKGPIWEGGKVSEDKPDERDEKEDGQYLPPSMKMVEKDGEYKVVKKSLIERRYGSQLARTYDIGKSCGVCGKISKSVGEEGHEGHSGCCADCRKSMNSVRWHDSHLS